MDWWPGHPEDPYLQEEDLRRSPATELIAWYCGYHHHRPNRWGIYIRERAVIAVAQDLHARMAQKGRCDLTVGEVRNLFFDKVWHHEYFHHLAEAAVTRLELRHGIPLYPRRLQHYRTMRRTGRFIGEEMCANAYAIDRVSTQVFVRPDGHYRSTRGLEALQEWMGQQPPGYNAFDRALGPIHRILALRTLAEDSLPDHPELHHEFLHDVLDEFAGNGRLYRTGKDAVPLFLVDRLQEGAMPRIVPSRLADLLDETAFGKSARPANEPLSLADLLPDGSVGNLVLVPHHRDNQALAWACHVTLERALSDGETTGVTLVSTEATGVRVAGKLADAWKGSREALAKLPVTVLDRPAWTLGELGEALSMADDWPAVLVIDDMTRVVGGETKAGKQESAEVAHGLKELAEDGLMTVVAFLPLDLTREEAASPRPDQLAKVGSPDLWADVVLWLYRQAWFQPVPDDRQDRLVGHVQRNRHGWEPTAREMRLMQQGSAESPEEH